MDLFEGTWYLQAVDVEGNTVGTMRLTETEATTLRETLLHMRGTFDDVDSAGLPDILLEVLKSSLSSRMLTSEGLGSSAESSLRYLKLPLQARTSASTSIRPRC